MSATKTTQRGSIIDAKDLRFFLRIAAKNWYFVVIALVLSLVLSYLYTYKLPNIYGASTQILLKDREAYDYQSQVYKSLGYAGVYGDLVNQKRVLTSYDLIDETLDKLDFDVSYFIVGRFKTSQVHGTLPFTVQMEPLEPSLYERLFDLRILDSERYELSFEFKGVVQKRVHRFDEPVKDPLYLLTVKRTPWLTKEKMGSVAGTDYQFKRHQRERLVNRYKGRIQVENQDFTTILGITVEDEVESRAKTFLDTLSKVYIDHTLKSEFEINQNTVNYIDKQIDEVTVILTQHEDELQNYKENKDILDLTREENLFFSELVGYEREIRMLELRIRSYDELENYLLNSADEVLLPPALYITSDEFLQTSLEEIYAQQLQRNSMLYEARPMHGAIELVDTTLQKLKLNVLTYLDNSRMAVQAKIRDLQGQVSDYEVMIRKLPKSQRDILNIQRRLQVNERMYMFLLEKRASTVIARAGIVPQTKVIESARSMGVVRPDKTKVVYTFLLGGVLAAAIIIFIRIMFYDRIENADELKEHTVLPIFGEIIASEKAEENYVVVDSDPKAAITESFRTVRTNLEYIPGPEQGGKVVMVTSYRPNEGKTFCSVNLSAILAKAGKRVLLLEFDLHKPKVATGLGMQSEVGLSNVLIGKMDWRSVVLPTQFEHFDVILAGPTPPNASELVLSKHLERIFTEARDMYDYVIVDTPPVGLITDALLMMRYVDATLFVVNTRFASKDHVSNALEVLQANPSKNTGFILNGVRMKKSKYYYNTNYGYGYRYAYGYGSGYGYGYGYGRRSKRSDDEGAKKDTRA